MTNFNIGVSAEANVKSEILRESKKVLEAIALKYNCKFDFNNSEIKSSSKAVVSKVRKQEKSLNRTGLSVFGEIDL